MARLYCDLFNKFSADELVVAISERKMVGKGEGWMENYSKMRRDKARQALLKEEVPGSQVKCKEKRKLDWGIEVKTEEALNALYKSETGEK
jgi:hypothetical protein